MKSTTTNGRARTELRNGEDAYRAAIRYALDTLMGTDFNDPREAEMAADNAGEVLEDVLRTGRFDTKATTLPGSRETILLH
jgi:hypothetical protein